MPKKGAREEPVPALKEQNLQNKSNPKEKKFGIEIEGIFASKLKRKKSEESLPGLKKSSLNNNKSNSTEKKVVGNETNETFSSNKTKNAQKQKLKQKEDAVAKPKRLEKKKVKINENEGFVDQPSKSRKRTGDGLVVYILKKS